MKRFYFFGMSVLSLLMAAQLWAQPGPGRFMNADQDDEFEPRLVRVLDLTEDQQAKIEAWQLELQKANLERRGDLPKLHTELQLMIVDEKMSEAKIKALVEKINAHQQANQLERIMLQRKIRTILSDQQKIRFDKMILDGPGQFMRHQRPQRGGGMDMPGADCGGRRPFRH
jgi:Spy/CpxP family protein refolding chaperone